MEEWTEDWCTYEIYADNEFGRLSYFGHTGDFIMRQGTHLTSYAHWVRNGRPSTYGRGCSSVHVLDLGGWEMKRLKDFKTEAEAIKHERELIKNKPCVNKQIPLRSHKEWRKDNAEHLRAYMQEWVLNHKDWLKTYRANRYQNKRPQLLAQQAERNAKLPKYHCECGSIIAAKSVNVHLKSKKHHDLMTNAPPPVLKHPRLAEKIPCECGLMIGRSSMNAHLKTQNHANRMTASTSGT